MEKFKSKLLKIIEGKCNKKKSQPKRTWTEALSALIAYIFGILVSIITSISILITILNLQGCNEPDKVVFHGRMVFEYSGDVFELKEYSDSITFNLKKIAENAYYASVSPDYKYLLYCSYSDSITFLQNLITGEATPLFNFIIKNVSWSTDASKFSYQCEVPQALFVHYIKNGYSKLIYEGEIMSYNVENSFFREGRGIKGEVSSGKWINADMIVFQRIPINDFPDRISSDKLHLIDDYYTIPASKTTIALVGDTIDFTDYLKRKWVTEISDDGSWTLYSEFDTQYSYSSEESSNILYLTNKFLFYNNDNAYPIDCSQYELVGFIKHSSKLFYLNKINFLGYQQLLIVDPQNLKVMSKLTLEQYGDERRNEFIMDQSKNYFAYFMGPEIQVYNINTGSKLIINIGLPKVDSYGYRTNGEILAWSNN